MKIWNHQLYINDKYATKNLLFLYNNENHEQKNKINIIDNHKSYEGKFKAFFILR